MIKNIEVIVSKDIMLYDTLLGIENNHIPAITYTNLRSQEEIDSFLESNRKITTLILDVDSFKSEGLLPLTQNIINLTNTAFSPLETKFKKPFLLNRLVNHLNYLRSEYNHNLFCYINDEFLFNAKENIIIYRNKPALKLTSKETELLETLITAPNYQLEKDILLQKIWGISSEIDTNTLETHISRLKHKISNDFIQLKDNTYFLKISDLL